MLLSDGEQAVDFAAQFVGGGDVRDEWSSMRRHDIGFLVTIRPTNTPEQPAYRRDSPESFVRQMGLVCVRGCEIEGLLGEDGKLIGDDYQQQQKQQQRNQQRGYDIGKAGGGKSSFSSHLRTHRVQLDANQYKLDNDKLMASKPGTEDIYNTFNVFVRRRPKENNFKAILDCIRDMMNTSFVVPDWLRDLILGYGDPAAACYTSAALEPRRIATLDFNDTFLSYEHLVASFPADKYELVLQQQQQQQQQQTIETTVPRPPFRLTFVAGEETANATDGVSSFESN